MRNLAPSKFEDDLLHTLWLQRLPDNLQQVLSVCKAPLDKLTQIADKVHEVSGSDLTVARIETKLNQIELDVLKDIRYGKHLPEIDFEILIFLKSPN
ncbi:uncharacterized protein TNCV_813391 [Trichonephila clavipes]|nr:uncharacterized protein TNCV_813391 [Trichonephila clavipes]